MSHFECQHFFGMSSLTVNDHVSKYVSYVQFFLLSFPKCWDSRRRIAWFKFWAIELNSIYCMDISVLSCLCMYKLVISWHSLKPNNQVFYDDIAGTISCSLSDDEDLYPRLFSFLIIFDNSVFKFRFNYRATYFWHLELFPNKFWFMHPTRKNSIDSIFVHPYISCGNKLFSASNLEFII